MKTNIKQKTRAELAFVAAVIIIRDEIKLSRTIRGYIDSKFTIILMTGFKIQCDLFFLIIASRGA